MSAASIAKASSMPQARDRVSNGSAMLPGIDGRSRGARRYRGLLAAFAAEVPGPHSAATVAMLRQAAGVAVQCETLQAAIVNGEPVDAEQLVRLSNTLQRTLRALGIGQPEAAEPKPKTLAEHLAERNRAPAA